MIQNITIMQNTILLCCMQTPKKLYEIKNARVFVVVKKIKGQYRQPDPYKKVRSLFRIQRKFER
jgi:hypothetical protein